MSTGNQSIGQLLSKYSRVYNSKNISQLFNDVMDIFENLNYPEGVEILEKYHEFKDSTKREIDRDTTLLIVTYGLVTYLRKTREMQYHELANELESSILEHEVDKI
jgi:hypothetical protein